MIEKREISEEKFNELRDRGFQCLVLEMTRMNGVYRYYIGDATAKIRLAERVAATFRNRVRKNALHIHEEKRRMRGTESSPYHKTDCARIRKGERSGLKMQGECRRYENRARMLCMMQAEYDAAGGGSCTRDPHGGPRT